MGTKQFNNKKIHRQQVKTGFLREWENRSPGLFQDYSRTFSYFEDSIPSQFCITQRLKMDFLQPEAAKWKAHSISLILTPVIKTGTSTQIE